MREVVPIFDFGNVVAFFDYGRAFARLAPAGIDPARLLTDLKARGFTPLLQRYECGQIGSGEFHQGFCELLGQSIPFDTFATAWADIFWLNPAVSGLVDLLDRAGYRLILGSNTNPIHADHFVARFDATLGRFDRLVLSYQARAIKPSPEFYRACVLASEVPPDRCVFIDDLPENVEAARSCGLQAVLYDQHEAVLERLAKLGLQLDW